MTTHYERIGKTITGQDADLMRLLGISHANTLRRYIADGRVPPPDKKISQKTRYWHRSTLERAGLITPVTEA